MQFKTKNIVVNVSQTKKTSDIIISMSIPFPGVASCCLNNLKANCSPGGLMKGSEESAISYALFETIRDKLMGSGLEVFKTKVSNITCSYVSGHLTITWNTQGTGSALRKTCGIALAATTPHKFFSKYSENMRFLSGKNGNKETFNFALKKLAEGIKKSVVITAIGKINITSDKLKEVCSVLQNKFPDVEIPSAKEISAPETRSVVVDEKKPVYPVIKASGIELPIVADYVRNNSNGFSVSIVDGGVRVYNVSWPSKQAQLKENKRIKDYIEKKYEKLQDRDELPALFAYLALSQGYADANIASKIISSKLKPAQMVDILKSALK